MATYLLVVIYLAFISLGLPDSALGSVWPAMSTSYGVSLGHAGIVSIAIVSGTIVSSLLTGTLIRKFGTALITITSVLLTASALFGFAFAPETTIYWLFLFAIPLGLGGGAVDAALNSYVAENYDAHHMSWLHAFWGVGATSGPIIIAQSMNGDQWRDGYVSIALIQAVLVVILIVTLILWPPAKNKPIHNSDEFINDAHIRKPWKLRGVPYALAVFVCYCGVEASMGLWGATFLYQEHNLSAVDAAFWGSMFFAGITLGRFISGFVTFRMSNRALIRMGQTLTVVGIAFMLLPTNGTQFAIAAYLLTGIGLAPIFPCMIHETPNRFGKAASQSIIGYQMAFAYVGATFIPPLFGLIVEGMNHSTRAFPLYAMVGALAMVFTAEQLNKLKVVD